MYFSKKNKTIFFPSSEDHGFFCSCYSHKSLLRHTPKHNILGANEDAQPPEKVFGEYGDDSFPLLSIEINTNDR